MSYDVDIVVVGAGPAGLAAAIRARWVKTAAAVPASVAVLDPGGPGGIAALGTIRLTGPGWAYAGRELITHLQDDIDALQIPLLRQTVTAIARAGDGWQVETDQGALRCLAVVLATGLRRLGSEAALIAGGQLIFLAGGYARSADIFMTWSEMHRDQHLVLIGGAGVADTARQFISFDGGRNHITPLVENQGHVSFRRAGPEVLVTLDADGVRSESACTAVMLDYHSLELSPPALAFLPAQWRTEQGFSAAGPHGRADLPGIFAAGDCTGVPSLCLKALAQGVEAGFAAYRHVFLHKFGELPPLFAFYPHAQRPPLIATDLPSFARTDYEPVGLVADSPFPPLPWLASGRRVADGVSAPPSPELLKAEIAAKRATIHRG
jgi:thioredoxin reductase (NADPH)